KEYQRNKRLPVCTITGGHDWEVHAKSINGTMHQFSFLADGYQARSNPQTVRSNATKNSVQRSTGVTGDQLLPTLQKELNEYTNSTNSRLREYQKDCMLTTDMLKSTGCLVLSRLPYLISIATFKVRTILNPDPGGFYELRR